MKDDTLFKTVGCGMVVAWTIGVMASAGIAGAVIWGIVKLVQKCG